MRPIFFLDVLEFFPAPPRRIVDPLLVSTSALCVVICPDSGKGVRYHKSLFSRFQTNRPISEEVSATNKPISEKVSATNKPISEEVSATNRPISEEVSATNRPISEEVSATNRPISEEVSATSKPIKPLQSKFPDRWSCKDYFYMCLTRRSFPSIVRFLKPPNSLPLPSKLCMVTPSGYQSWGRPAGFQWKWWHLYTHPVDISHGVALQGSNESGDTSTHSVDISRGVALQGSNESGDTSTHTQWISVMGSPCRVPMKVVTPLHTQWILVVGSPCRVPMKVVTPLHTPSGYQSWGRPAGFQWKWWHLYTHPVDISHGVALQGSNESGDTSTHTQWISVVGSPCKVPMKVVTPLHTPSGYQSWGHPAGFQWKWWHLYTHPVDISRGVALQGSNESGDTSTHTQWISVVGSPCRVPMKVLTPLHSQLQI